MSMSEPSRGSKLMWSPQELTERLKSAGISVVDTRPAELFAGGRIPGARHFDPYFVNSDDTSERPLWHHRETCSVVSHADGPRRDQALGAGRA